ncbi:MAG TPA: urease accessory protein UreD [Dehalococcoidia bacterium]|nr:urease accessory protein UreD [Dehalococcoidia bacterium]
MKTQAPLDLRGPLRSAGQHDLYYLRNNTTGILDGDCYEIDVSTCAGARVQVASPSAAKVLAMDGNASSRQRIEAGPGSTLIWGPHALILQQGADFSQQTSVVLAGGVVLLSEVIVFGRLAAGESCGYKRFQSEFQICDQAGEVLYGECYTLRPDAPGLQGALGGMGAMASFYALGIEDSETLTAALASGACSQTFSGCSSLPNQAGVVARMLAPSLSQALAFCDAAITTGDAVHRHRPTPRRQPSQR